MIRTPVVLTPIPSPSGQVLTPCPPLPSGEGELTTSPIRRNGEEERGTAIPTPDVVATLRCGSDYLGDLLRTSNRYDRVMDRLRHVTSASPCRDSSRTPCVVVAAQPRCARLEVPPPTRPARLYRGLLLCRRAARRGARGRCA